MDTHFAQRDNEGGNVVKAVKEFKIIYYTRGGYLAGEKTANTLDEAEETASEFMRDNGYVYSYEIWKLIRRVKKEAMP